MQFLVGLNDDYKVTRGSILMMKPLPSIDQVYQLVSQEEKQRSLSAMSHISNNAAAFHASDIVLNEHSALVVQQKHYSGPGQFRTSYNPGGAGNTSGAHNSHYGSNVVPRPLQRLAGQDRRQYFCDHCKVAGHTIQRCYKIHGYPPGHKLYKGKRMAAAVHNDQADCSITNNLGATQSSSLAPPLTSEQHSQLMQLLSKYSSDMEKYQWKRRNWCSRFLGR